MTKIKWGPKAEWENGDALVGGTIVQTRQKHNPPIVPAGAVHANGNLVMESYVIVAGDKIEFFTEPGKLDPDPLLHREPGRA